MKELLAIDVGNTNVKYGLFLKGKLSKTWSHPTADTALACVDALKKCSAPVAIASVVPAAGELIKAAAEKRLLLEVTGSNQGILSNMAAEMGADRVADAVAAWVLHGGANKAVLAFSFGTASTALAINASGEVIGGWIMPGMSAQLRSMHEQCALLPLLSMDKPSLQLGVDTETHMRNGVFVGNLGAAREWLKAASRQLSAKPVSVATGGWASTLQQYGKVFDHVDTSLTLKGIHLIASRSAARKRKRP
jgi:type III pantothenate kinase